MLQQNIHKPQKHLDGYYRRKILSWLSRHSRLVRTLALWIGVPLCIILIAGFVPFSNNMLREKAVRMLEKASGAACSVQRLTITPWFGFSMDGLELTKKDRQMMWQVSIPHVRLSYRVLPLLFRYVVIQNFALEKPQMRLVLPASQRQNQAQEKAFTIEDIKQALAGSPFTVAVKNISVEEGAVTVEQKGQGLFAGSGINIRMRIGYAKTLALSGKASAERLTLYGLWDIENVRTSVRVNDLDVVLENCKGDFYGGKCSASGEADLGENMLEGFRAELSRVDLTRLYQASRIRQGQCDGRLDAKVEFGRSILAADSLKGRGKVALSKVSVHDLPLQNSLIVFIAVPQLRNITFSKISTSLEVHNGKIFTPDVRGDGDPIEIRADGWVAFDGYFSHRLDGIFSRELANSFHRVIANSLDDAPDGRKSFKCTVYGKFKNPQIEIDRQIQQRAVSNVIDEVGRGLGNLFKR
jgi:hypothetical protein